MKDNHGKPQLHQIPMEAVAEAAKVMAYGEGKYEKYNWRHGTEYSVRYDAAMRHLIVWWEGTDLDNESGLSHIAHAMCNLLMLMWYILRGVGTDDRPKREGEKQDGLRYGDGVSNEGGGLDLFRDLEKIRTDKRGCASSDEPIPSYIVRGQRIGDGSSSK